MKIVVKHMSKKKSRVLTSGKVKSRITRRLNIAASTTEGQVHVIPRSSAWIIKKEGAERAYRVYDIKAKALAGARSMLSSGLASSIVIHDKYGRIDSIES